MCQHRQIGSCPKRRARVQWRRNRDCDALECDLWSASLRRPTRDGRGAGIYQASTQKRCIVIDIACGHLIAGLRIDLNLTLGGFSVRRLGRLPGGSIGDDSSGRAGDNLRQQLSRCTCFQ